MAIIIYKEDKIKEILPKWQYKNNSIGREFKFVDFKSAFSFMTKIAFFAEIQDHHPNWSNVYNSLSIVLYTHTHNAVTEKDIELAKIIDKEYDFLNNNLHN